MKKKAEVTLKIQELKQELKKVYDKKDEIDEASESGTMEMYDYTPQRDALDAKSDELEARIKDLEWVVSK